MLCALSSGAEQKMSSIPHTTTSSSIPAGSQQGGFAAATGTTGVTHQGINPAVLGNSPLATSVGERDTSTKTGLDSAIGTNLGSSSATGSAAHTSHSAGTTATTSTTSSDAAATPIKIDIDAAKQRGQELLEQGRQGAKELVDSKPVEERNEGEAHVGNLASGLAGVVLTAPLAAIEKVSPQVSQTIDNAASTVGQQLSNMAHNAGPTAQNALETVKSYLPASLGGGASSTHASTSPSTTTTSTTSSTGPTVTERASDAAASAGQSISSTAQSAAETARSYLPESIANKLPGSAQSTTTTGSSSVESPYVARSEIKVSR